MPTSPRCRCHLCRPAALTDPLDRRLVQDVRRHGIHIVAVGTGSCDCCDCCGDPEEDAGPAFAYTVGLPPQAGPPELVVSGLRVELMHSMLNSAAERVLAGFRFEAATTAENLLSFWPVVADPMALQGIHETVRLSRWFHRRQVDALQLVWPSAATGIFPWQPGASAAVAEAQPESWRLPQQRSGALAADPDWAFPVPADHLALACTHVTLEGAPVHDVVRLAGPEATEQWQFFCPQAHHDLDEDMCAYHFAHLVRRVPSLRSLHDLGLGEEASRPTPWAPWSRRLARVA